jgi:hypothetical protein
MNPFAGKPALRGANTTRFDTDSLTPDNLFPNHTEGRRLMTAKFATLGALFLLAAAIAGCFNSAAMQQMQEANQSYSISPNFELDRNWRIAILPPRDGDTELPDLYDRAGLLLMKPGNFTLIDRTEIARILHEQWSGGPRLIDAHSASKLGRRVGAEAVMTINVTDLKHDEFFKDNPEQRDARVFVKIISVKTAEALYYAEGRGTSFEGPEAALSDALAMALGPLIRNGKG